MRRFRNQILSAMGIGPAATVLIALALPACSDDDDKGQDSGMNDVGADADEGGAEDGGTEDGGTEDGGTEDGGTDDGGTNDGGTDDGGTDDTGDTDGGTDDGGTDDTGDTGGGDEGGDEGGETDGGDPTACEAVPDLTGYGWSPMTDEVLPDAFLICDELPLDSEWSSCPAKELVFAYTLLYEHFVDPDSLWGDPTGTITCGPDASRMDACCYVVEEFGMLEWYEGRPFTVHGQARIAPCSKDNGWSQASEWMASGMTEVQRARLVTHWTETAQFEHASVASFARFTMQLMAVGAPADLIAEATRAQSDEIRHARVCLGIASTLADETIGLGALPIDGALEDAGSVAAILVDTIKEACVNETISAAVCQAAGEAAADAFIRDALLAIAEDEQRHSTLAWKTVRWLLSEHPELHDLARATFDEAIAQPWGSSAEATGDLTPWGVMSRAQEQAVATRVMRRVVRPCADALLGTHDGTEISA